METKEKSYIKQAFESAYTEVCDSQQRITALHYALKPIRDKRNYNKEVDQDFSKLHCALFSELNEAYRKLFMWGIISGDQECMRKAKEAAFDRYLRENCEIMSYLSFSPLESYPSDLEKQFRVELEILKKS